MIQPQGFNLFRLVLLLVLCTGLLAACSSGGGGGGGGAPAPSPAEGSTWEEMVWDQGKWG